jgi:hypothetical protein
MLILDLQSKKKAILQQILDIRQELVMLDKREMAVIARASHVQASDGERTEEGLPSVRDPPPAPSLPHSIRAADVQPDIWCSSCAVRAPAPLTDVFLTAVTVGRLATYMVVCCSCLRRTCRSFRLPSGQSTFPEHLLSKCMKIRKSTTTGSAH